MAPEKRAAKSPSVTLAEVPRTMVEQAAAAAESNNLDERSRTQYVPLHYYCYY